MITLVSSKLLVCLYFCNRVYLVSIKLLFISGMRFILCIDICFLWRTRMTSNQLIIPMIWQNIANFVWTGYILSQLKGHLQSTQSFHLLIKSTTMSSKGMENVKKACIAVKSCDESEISIKRKKTSKCFSKYFQNPIKPHPNISAGNKLICCRVYYTQSKISIFISKLCLFTPRSS